MRYNITWTEEKKEKAIKLVSDFIAKYGPGECIMQNDDALIYAADVFADIADDILIEGDGIIYNEDKDNF